MKKLVKTADWFSRFSLNQLEEGAFGEIAQGYQTILSEIAFHWNSHKKYSVDPLLDLVHGFREFCESRKGFHGAGSFCFMEQCPPKNCLTPENIHRYYRSFKDVPGRLTPALLPSGKFSWAKIVACLILILITLSLPELVQSNNLVNNPCYILFLIIIG